MNHKPAIACDWLHVHTKHKLQKNTNFPSGSKDDWGDSICKHVLNRLSPNLASEWHGVKMRWLEVCGFKSANAACFTLGAEVVDIRQRLSTVRQQLGS